MACKQDMPPEGGYNPITYQRVPLKPGLNPYAKMGAVALFTAFATYCWHRNKNIWVNRQLEMKSAYVALTPMLQAEVDRMFLKQLKKNRDAEEQIMQNVQGWEVGKWQGMPVYLTSKPDEFYRPSAEEYYVHANTSDKRHAYFLFSEC